MEKENTAPAGTCTIHLLFFIFSFSSSAKICYVFSGVTTLMPLLGGFLANAYLGRFFTVLASSIIFILGLLLLTLSNTVPVLKPCDTTICPEPRKVHEVAFYLGIYLVSIGTGGHKPSPESFGADQFDDNHAAERRKKMSFFNWWNSGLCSGLLLAFTLVAYMEDQVSWAAAYIILTVVMGVTLIIFCLGRPFYRYRIAAGSPFIPMLQVILAAIAKEKLPYPSNAAELYEVPKSTQPRGRFLCHTQKLKFLDKTAIVDEKEKFSRQKAISMETCNCD